MNIDLEGYNSMTTSKTAKLFMNGNSQAVRLPQEFRFEGKEVRIRKEGNNVILSPKPQSWREFFESDLWATEDFMETRNDELPEKREELF